MNNNKICVNMLIDLSTKYFGHLKKPPKAKVQLASVASILNIDQ